MMTNFLTQSVNANEGRLPKDKSANERDERTDAFAGLLLSLNNTARRDAAEKPPEKQSFDLGVLNNRRGIQDAPSQTNNNGSNLAVLNNRRGIQDTPVQNRDKTTPPLSGLQNRLTENETNNVDLNLVQQPPKQNVFADTNQVGDVSSKADLSHFKLIKNEDSITSIEAKTESYGGVNIKAELFSNAPTQAVKETLIAKDVQILSNARANNKSSASIFSEIKSADEKNSLKKTDENNSNSTQEREMNVRQEENKAIESSGKNNQSEQFNSSEKAPIENQEDVFSLDNTFSKDFESAFNSENSKTIELHSSLSSTFRNTNTDSNIPKIVSQTLAALVAEAKSSQANQEIRFLRFRLNPEKFGTLEIKIQSDVRGNLSAQLMTEHETARRALTEGMSQLKRELEDAGFQIERLNVNIGQSMTRQSNAQSDGQGFSSNEFTNTSFSVPTEKQTDNSESEIEQDRLLSVRA